VTLNNGQISFSMEPNSIRLFQFVIPELVSVHELGEEIELRVYPNPVAKELTIESNEIIGSVQLLSVTGEELSRFDVQDTVLKHDLSDLPIGVYYFHLTELAKTVKVVHQ